MSLTLDELRERVKMLDEILSALEVHGYPHHMQMAADARLALRELIAELREINERSGIEMAFAALLAELEDDDVDA